MKLRATALRTVGTLALGGALAAWTALMPCAGYLSQDEPPPFGAQLAWAEESAADTTDPDPFDDEATPCISVDAQVAEGAPRVSIATAPSELDFLLNDAEQAALSAGTPVCVYLTSTPLVPDIPEVTAPGGGKAECSEEVLAEGAEGKQPALQALTAQQDTQNTQGEQGDKEDPNYSPSSKFISAEDFSALVEMANSRYSYSSDPEIAGIDYPFDISLWVCVEGGDPHKVTDLQQHSLLITVELTNEMLAEIQNTQGDHEDFNFFLFHRLSGTEGPSVEQVGGAGTHETLSITGAVSSFSPFLLAWRDLPLLGSSLPPTGGGSGGSSGIIVMPSPAPDPADPTPPDIPAADEPQTPVASAAEPFLAWSPKQGTRSVRLRWTQVDDADGYLIYRCRCNSGGVKRTPKLAAVLPAGSSSLTFRNLRKGCWYKQRVEAFKLEDGERVVLAASPLVHASTLGGKSRTASAVKITGVHDESGAPIALRAASQESSGLQVLELSAGQQVQLFAREYGRKLIVHHRGMRYASADEDVARVTHDGRLVATGAGTCKIWAFAQSGAFHMIELRVA